MTDMIERDTADMTQPVFTIQNIYVKDLSFEAPRSPLVFQEEWQPKLDFDLQLASEKLEDNLYEVALQLTLTVHLPNPKEEQVAFLLEIVQGGLFTIEGLSDAELEHVLATTCPVILFPYARELASSLMTRGGFPQLFLPPINFEGMYRQHLEQKETQQTA